MSELTQYLLTLADRLDRDGKPTCADAVTELIKTASLDKVSQYVGVIGYVLKQNRAMGNCIRKKRVATKGSMQDVVMSCLKEYQDGQEYQDDQWVSKYAQTISQRPELFKTAHLSFLQDLGQEWEITEHINNIRTASQVFHDNDVDEEQINLILSHVETLGEMLKKEAVAYRPFKVAAPPKRSLWSRFWNPGEGDVWSPMGWGSKGRTRRWRGDDKDLDLEMDHILRNVMSITTLASTMKSSISRLQRDSKYLTREISGLSPKEIDAAEKIEEVINRMDPNDWLQTNKDVLELSSELHGVSTYNSQLMNRAMHIATDLNKSRIAIDENIDDIRTTMQSLRSRGAISGHRPGATSPIGSPGQSQQIGMEFEMLDRVIDQVDKNPLDKEGHYLAQQQVNRLNAALEGEQPSAEYDFETHNNINSWIERSQSGSELPQPSARPMPPIEDPQMTEVAPQTATPAVDVSRAPEIAEYLKSKGIDAEVAAQAFEALAAVPDADNVRELLFALVNEFKRPGSTRATDVSETPPTGDLPPTIESSPEATERPVVQMSPSEASRAEDLIGNLDEMFPEESPMLQNASFNSVLVRLADAVDPICQEIADTIDDYISEHGDQLPQQPEFGVIVKEKKE